MNFVERYGPWALVTGASAGIGAEFARQLAARGLHLVLLARRKDKLEELALELRQKHRIEVRVLAADLARADFADEVGAALAAQEIGLLVNNAGFGITGEFLRHDLERESDLLAVNCRALMILTHRLGPPMAQRKRGGIIFVSSVLAFLATPYSAHYAASKVYELSLAQGLRYELGRYGVDVLALCPGSTDTEFHDVAGSRAVGAMAVEPVVRQGLAGLGRRSVVIPGWRNRLLVGLLKFAPRALSTTFAGQAMRRLGRVQK
ncbi:MAG: SDR family oxidoreductase [Deltaproteobacteria bacterium]|nr:SDR family oxidoreductase [Deltaproteobacteria bacterium]